MNMRTVSSNELLLEVPRSRSYIFGRVSMIKSYVLGGVSPRLPYRATRGGHTSRFTMQALPILSTVTPKKRLDLLQP